jgi:hypothetical protein
MAFDLGLRDGRCNSPEDRKGLTIGTHIEADMLTSGRFSIFMS